jgi:hypothetical protein
MVGNTLYYMKKRKQNIPIYCIINTVWFYRTGNDMTGCGKIYLDS